jgi:hypothetical protein
MTVITQGYLSKLAIVQGYGAVGPPPVFRASGYIFQAVDRSAVFVVEDAGGTFRVLDRNATFKAEA